MGKTVCRNIFVAVWVAAVSGIPWTAFAASVEDRGAREWTRRDLRANDAVYASVGEFVGLVTFGWGLTVGMNLSPDWALELDGYCEGIGRQVYSLAPRVQYFATDTLYLRAGPRIRTLTRTSRIGLESRGTRKLTQTDVGVDVSFGNRWRWSWFYFGIDWLGAYQPAVVLYDAQRDRVPAGETLTPDETGARTPTHFIDLRIAYVQIGGAF